MRCREPVACALFVAALSGCGAQGLGGRPDGAPADGVDLATGISPGPGPDLAGGGMPDLAPLAPNVVPITIDAGPTGAMFSSYNVPFISIQLCAPGTSTCQTIDHVAVDTGSVGLRVLSSVLSPALAAALPALHDGHGDPLAECYTFADGYVWGAVRSADLSLGGEHVAGLALQVIGDPALPTVPKACKDTGTAEDTLDAFGSNAIIGLGNYAPDCGDLCEDASQFGDGWQYYGCANAGSCAQVTVPQAQQLQNPVALLPVDNNGVLLQLPTVGDDGAAGAAGVLVLGIGTQTNNALGGATLFPIGDEDSDGSITVKFGGSTLVDGYFDSGTTDFSFDDAALPACMGDFAGWDCPAAPLDLTAQNVDGGGTAHAVTFHVASAMTLLASDVDTAFDDIASPVGDRSTFIWGLPFFYGRSVFTAIAGRTTPGGPGPYFAY